MGKSQAGPLGEKDVDPNDSVMRMCVQCSGEEVGGIWSAARDCIHKVSGWSYCIIGSVCGAVSDRLISV